MTNLFDKVVVFSDIHLGLKNNSREHNVDCVNFVEWMIKEAHDRGVKTCIFGGDWHHSRSTINVSTLNYSTNLFRQLDDAFDDVYFIVGNHDLFYKEKREISSIDFGKDHPNFHLINEPTVIGNVGLIPWVVGEEWNDITKMQVKYMFGHFEFPRFLVNANYEMPDHGKYVQGDLSHVDLVFSGHFHKRQRRGNIQYVGNCFPHSFSDVDEEQDRGIMFLEWGAKKPEFKMWPGTPRYRYRTLSHVVENIDEIEPKTFLRATLDVEADFEDVSFVRETVGALKNMKEFTLLPRKRELIEAVDDPEEFESVDATVISNLQQIESKMFDSNFLIQIYSEL